MIISIKSSSAGGSSRGLVHYLAHSKFDPEKEGIERREFFNESENNLDVRAANKHLSLNDAKPKPEELLHVVIAPSDEEIEKVGATQRTRKDALKEIVRETVARLEKEVKAKNLKWVAALHFNTDHPHAHLAVQKEFTNEKGEPENLRITRQMLHYNEVSENGEKKLHKGALILAAENKIEELAQTRRRETSNERNSESEKAAGKSKTQTDSPEKISSNEFSKIPNYRERRILAEEMLTSAEIARRTRNIENLVEHGDKKRFKINDERTGTARHVSLFDIERKIETVSRREAWHKYPQNPKKREQFAQSVSGQKSSEYEPLIRGLETIRRHVLGFENRHLSKAEEKHARLHNQKLLIEKKYERLKTPVPLPLFGADEIQRLQTEAVREQNTEKILSLENIRQSNALELNRAGRRDEDVRELLAARIVANLKVQAAEKRLRNFSASKDFVKVKIGDSHLSRNGLRQHEIQNHGKDGLWTQIKSKTSGILFSSSGKASTIEKLDYTALHKAVADALENLEVIRRNEIAKQQDFNQTLDKIFQSETNQNKNKLAPAYSAYELAETEDLAQDAGRENFYENSLRLQENWLREKLAEKISGMKTAENQTGNSDGKIQNQDSPKTKSLTDFQSETDAKTASEKIIANFVLGRAEARSLLAQTKIGQAAENLAKFERDKKFIKHQIKDPKTGAARELSLIETEPRKHYYLIDNLLEKALEAKERKTEREAVREASQMKGQELEQNLKSATNFAERLENQKQAMLEKYTEGQKILPIFTPKEIAALDIRATQTANKSEAERLEKIINDAEKNGRVGRIHDWLEAAAKKLEILDPTLVKTQGLEISQKGDFLGERQITEINWEIKTQKMSVETAVRADGKSTEVELLSRENAVVKEKGRSR